MANLQISVQTDYNGRGIRQAQSDLQNTDRTANQLRDRIKGLQQVLDNTRPNSAQWTRYAAEVRSATDALEALRQRARTVGSTLPTSMGGATSSVIEFNRVIQDAPFGIQGVGNNIQALTQNLGYLVAQTGSARRATSVFFSTLITPANLAVLAVSALTTAWTIYARSQQGANKEAAAAAKALREQKSALDDFVETLDAQGRVSVRAASAASEETTKLRVLYGITQDVTMSMQQRNRAADQLQKVYPEYFKNQTNEAILAGDAARAYDKLASSILATARARAAVDISAENQKQLVALDIKRTRNAEARADAEKQLAKAEEAARKEEQRQGANPGRNDTAPRTSGVIAQKLGEAREALQNINDEDREDYKKKLLLMQDDYNLQKIINAEVKKGADIIGKPGQDFSTKPKILGTTNPIQNALTSSSNATASEGLDGVEKQLEKLKQEYQGYYADIDKFVKESKTKGIDVTSEAEKAKTQLVADEAKRRTLIEVSESQRVAEQVRTIEDQSGVSSEQSLSKQLAQAEKWRNDWVSKAQGVTEVLVAIEQGYQQQVENIRNEFNQKRLDAIDKISDKISAIEEQQFAQNKTGLADETKKLEVEINKRIKKINELYDAMQDLNSDGSVELFDLIEGMRNTSVAGVKQKGSQAQDSTDYQSAKALNAAVAKFTGDMYDSIASVGKKNAEITEKYNKARIGATDAEILKLNAMERQEKALANSFGSIFSSIFNTFSNSLNSLFKTTLTNLLKTSFTKGLEDLKFDGLSSKVSGAIVAGAALAGSAISSIGGGKNTFTSALGGALTGAAGGAVLGTAIGGPLGTVPGAVIGGLVGAIGGIFGSSSKRKEEELQKQQLEEQRKTNELLDRQNKLAYSAQIIGRMSDRGVITGVDVNEFGQLTTTIQGQDIVVSYDRTKKNQQRGI